MDSPLEGTRKYFHKKKISLFGLKTSLEINAHLIRSSLSKGNDVEFWVGFGFWFNLFGFLNLFIF